MDGRQRHLTTVHLHQLAQLRDRTSAAVLSQWDRLGYYDTPHAEAFVPAATALVAAGQRLTIATTRSYLARSTHQRIAAPDPHLLSPTALRHGTPPAEVYQRPFRQTWWRLSEGDDPADAIAQGRDRLDLTARTDLQLAARATGIVLAGAAGVAGWRRVADSGCCDLCAAADGEELGPDDEWGIHPNCGCGAEPMDSAPEPSADGEDPAHIDVHEHGELGAVLYQHGDEFAA